MFAGTWLVAAWARGLVRLVCCCCGCDLLVVVNSVDLRFNALLWTCLVDWCLDYVVWLWFCLWWSWCGFVFGIVFVSGDVYCWLFVIILVWICVCFVLIRVLRVGWF